MKIIKPKLAHTSNEKTEKDEKIKLKLQIDS